MMSNWKEELKTVGSWEPSKLPYGPNLGIHNSRGLSYSQWLEVNLTTTAPRGDRELANWSSFGLIFGTNRSPLSIA